MPGFAGIISQRLPGVCRELVGRMVGAISGNDSLKKALSVPELGLYAGSTAFSGMFPGGGITRSTDGNVALMLAGEISSEVAVGEAEAVAAAERYRGCGEEFLRRLNGMFSGLLVDVRSRVVLLFNDRYGVGKIYVHESNGDIYFASEARALLAVVPGTRSFDYDGVAELLAIGCTTGERTLYTGIRRLPGGTLWTLRHDSARLTRYFLPEEWESQEPLGLDAYCKQLEETLVSVVPKYCAGSTEVGVALTAGLDTRMLMSCRNLPTRGLTSYTFAGLSQETLDCQLARVIAESCGIRHHILRIGKDYFEEFPQLVDRTVSVTDGYAGALAAHEVYFNAKAREISPVRLTGNYGSEILRGVSTFKPWFLSDALVDVDLRTKVKRYETGQSRWSGSPITFAAFAEVPWKRFGIQAAGGSQLLFRTPYLDNDVVRLAYRAPCRIGRSAEPALRLVGHRDPALARIPTDNGNFTGLPPMVGLMRRYRRTTFKLDYFYNEAMPHSLCRFERHIASAGFRLGLLGQHKFMNYRKWFQSQLSTYVKSVISDSQVLNSGLWNRQFLVDAADRHIAGRKNYVAELGIVLTIEAIERLLLRAPVGVDGRLTEDDWKQDGNVECSQARDRGRGLV